MFTSLLIAAAVVAVGKCYPAKLNNINEPTIPAKYDFKYDVNAEAEGTSFSHQESRDNDLTKGNYEVQLPDGRIQKVTYTADENGFVAEVEYVGDVLVQGPQQSSSSFGAPVINANRPLPLETDFTPRAPQQAEFFPINQEQFLPVQDSRQFQPISAPLSDQFFNPQQSQPQEIQQSNTFQQLPAFPQQSQSFSPSNQPLFQPVTPRISRIQSHSTIG
ncbi:uncharacterized protein LOC123501562 [Portunus trituberculatus]|uniref:uncharacterized protein LOC123501562 n=1 Tax=Portunus trituberculatus TaxID=210409 RepID=UPI001E1D0F50|nr:uncharacterized protein LOC123501562 [Portunus trituberculatus]